MSPLRRHGGGRPRSAHSILDVAEQWGISQKAARRLAALKLGDVEMAILVCDSKRYAAAQRREFAASGQIHRRHESPGHAQPYSRGPRMSRLNFGGW